MQPSRLNFMWHSTRASEAPAPSDILWVNLDFSKRKRWWRKIQLGCIQFFLLSFVIALLSWSKQISKSGSAISYQDCQVRAVNMTMDDYLTLAADDCGCVLIGIVNVQSDYPPGSKTQCDAWVSDKIMLEAVRGSGAFVTAAVGGLIGPVNQALANFDRPLSLTQMNYNVMFNTAVFQIVNLGVIPIIVNANFLMPNGFLGTGGGNEEMSGIFGLFGNGPYSDIVSDWYISVGSAMMLALLANTFTTPLMGLTQAPLFWGKKWLCQRKVLLRKDLIDLFTPPDFPMPIRAGQAVAAIFVCVALSAALPLLWYFALVAIFLFYWTDKHMFIKASARPPRYASDLCYLAIDLMQVAILIHGGFGLFAYGDTEVSPSWSLTDYSSGRVNAEEYIVQLPENIGEASLMQHPLTLYSKIITCAQVASAFPQFMCMSAMLFIYMLRFTVFTFGTKFLETFGTVIQAAMPKLAYKIRVCWRSFASCGSRGMKVIGQGSNKEIHDDEMILYQAFSGKPSKEMRKMSIMVTYELTRMPAFSFLALENKRWTRDFTVKRNRQLGLADDGEELDYDIDEDALHVAAAAVLDLEADGDEDSMVKLGLRQAQQDSSDWIDPDCSVTRAKSMKLLGMEAPDEGGARKRKSKKVASKAQKST